MSLNEDPQFIQACELTGQGRYLESLNIFLELERNESQHATLMLMIASNYYELKEYAQSLVAINKCLEIDPKLHQANHLKGNTMSVMKNFHDALKAYENELKINPSYSDVLNDMGTLLFKLSREDEALQAYDKAIRLDATYADPLHNKAIILKRRAQFNEAKKILKKATQLKKNFYEAFAELANLHLYLCEFIDGWHYYATRFELELKGQEKFESTPSWTNTSVQGKKIVLYGEQGIGDQILFGTILREALLTRNDFIVLVDSRLISILRRSFSDFKNVVFLEIESKVNDETIDLKLAMGDLGKLFRTSIKSFAIRKDKYLFADLARVEMLKQKIKTNKINCGISWKSTRDTIGPYKSIAIEEWLPIFQLQAFNLINLQYGDTSRELNLLKNEHKIQITDIDALDKFNDIEGLLALIDACDIVITTSNVTAHLAGSLGKQTFLMVPFAKGRIWYWHNDMHHSIWYPTIKIFSQDKNEIWASVIKDICNELQKFSKAPYLSQI
jgi:Tfp pilus assembly protein PilF